MYKPKKCKGILGFLLVRVIFKENKAFCAMSLNYSDLLNTGKDFRVHVST